MDANVGVKKAPTWRHIEEAHARIRDHVHRTPVLTSRTLDELCDARIFCKCENFQKVGAFKARGAVNAVYSLSEQALAKGVVTHSSGNHGQAVAFAAGKRGARASIVMPRTAPEVKLAAVHGYGAEVIPCEPTLEARESTCAQIIAETGANLVHPFEDPRVIAGQATVAKELLEEISGIDLLIAPVGGGGLLSGTALTAKAFSPATRVIGAEPSGADDAQRSLMSGRLQPMIAPNTIADGLRTALGKLTFSIVRQHVAAIHTVEDDAIIAAMRWVWERMKILIEPSSAVALAVLLSGQLDVASRRVGLIFTGGNVDLDSLPWGGHGGG